MKFWTAPLFSILVYMGPDAIVSGARIRRDDATDQGRDLQDGKVSLAFARGGQAGRGKGGKGSSCKLSSGSTCTAVSSIVAQDTVCEDYENADLNFCPTEKEVCDSTFTVEQYCEDTGEGTGFLFEKPEPRALYYTIGWAVSTYYDRPQHFKTMQKEGMQRHFSWDDSVVHYEELYENALNRRATWQ